jgi:VanZ family protein
MEIIAGSYDSKPMPRRGRLLDNPLGRFGPPVALMGVIFLLSAQPDLNSGLGVFDLIGRKLVHATEYGLLWFLWLRALRFRHPWVAALICLAYSGSDEYHQTFVHGRHGTPVDMGFDMVGVALAAAAYYGLWRAPRRWLRRRRSDPAALGGDQDRLGAVDRPQLPVDVVEVGADGAGRER